MSEAYKQFVKDTEVISFDVEHRKKINFNISRYDESVIKGKKQYKDLEKAKERAANIKYKTINDLDKYLVDFEAKFTDNGGKLIWAQNKEEAVKEILKILKENKCKKIVKSKSMTTEEIDLNESLEKVNIESLETDLGEYIVQLAGEKPYHIVTPAMHKSKEDIAALFHEKFNIPEKSNPEEITKFVRKKLRKKFIEADAGITGANFLIADIGGVALTENEGNGLLSISFPKVHIVIAGIEKLIPDVKYLDLFWPLLSTHGTGQNITVYNSVITGPKFKGETDGPEKMYVILLDNNRTDLLSNERQRIALSCIRCGACLNSCPVYKNIGGYSYATTYSGPIGSVISPHLRGMKEFKHLSFASSLCGKCTDICPVKIPLHELLLLNRKDSVKRGYNNVMDKITMFGWKRVMLNRGLLDMFGGKVKNFMIKKFFRKAWGPRRKLPEIQSKSFNKLWKKTKN